MRHRSRLTPTPLARQLLIGGAVLAAIGIVVTAVLVPVVLNQTFTYLRGSSASVLRVTGSLLGLTKVDDEYTLSLDERVARVTDPGDVCIGMLQQTATELACVPFVLENGTVVTLLTSVGTGADVAIDGTAQVRSLVVNAPHSVAAVGNNVELTISIPVPEVTSIGAGAALAVNGTMHVRGLLVNAPHSAVVAGDDVQLTVAAPELTSVGAGAALAANGTMQVRSLLVNSPHTAVVVGNDVQLTIAASASMTPCGPCSPGDSVRLHANGSCFECYAAPATMTPCGPCAPGDSVRQHANGTCYECYLPAATMTPCGPCTPGDSVRLHANGTCYECYAAPAAAVLSGGGGVNVDVRSNDTLVYRPIWDRVPQPFTIQTDISGLFYNSGTKRLSSYAPGFPGYASPAFPTANVTAHSLDVYMEMSVVPAVTGSSASMLVSLTSLVPLSVDFTLVDPSDYTGYAHVSCTDANTLANPGGAISGGAGFVRGGPGIDVRFFFPGTQIGLQVQCSFVVHLDFLLTPNISP